MIVTEPSPLPLPEYRARGKVDRRNSAATPLLHIPLLSEVIHRFVGAAEHARRGFGDERRGHALAGPHDVDFFAAFEGMMQFALHARRETGLAVGELRHIADDHVGLID